MSFKEIKSLLRMVNVDMNDMYAYRLFKVGTATSLTSALSSPDHYRRPFSFPSSCCGHRASCSRKATPGSPYLLPPLPQAVGPGWECWPRASLLPLRQTPGVGRTGPSHHSQVSSGAVVFISLKLKPFAQVTWVVCTQEQREGSAHGHTCSPSSPVARVAPPHPGSTDRGARGWALHPRPSEHTADPCVDAGEASSL